MIIGFYDTSLLSLSPIFQKATAINSIGSLEKQWSKMNSIRVNMPIFLSGSPDSAAISETSPPHTGK